MKNQATKLFKTCIRGGVPVAKDLALFDFIDVEQVRKEPGEDESDDDGIRSLPNQRLDILDWLQQERLENPLGRMQSAYVREDGVEGLPFTNVTASFVGHLDYIFHDKSFQVEKRLHVPTTFVELGGRNADVRNAHVLPSNIWPSDHLAIGAVLSLSTDSEQPLAESMSSPSSKSIPSEVKPTSIAAETANPTKSVPPPVIEDLFCSPLNGASPPPPPPPIQQQHGERCDCGCVPNVMSLFEMAEMRKRRAAARRQAAS